MGHHFCLRCIALWMKWHKRTDTNNSICIYYLAPDVLTSYVLAQCTSMSDGMLHENSMFCQSLNRFYVISNEQLMCSWQWQCALFTLSKLGKVMFRPLNLPFKGNHLTVHRESLLWQYVLQNCYLNVFFFFFIYAIFCLSFSPPPSLFLINCLSLLCKCFFLFGDTSVLLLLVLFGKIQCANDR